MHKPHRIRKFLTSLLAGVSLTLTPGLAKAGNTYEDHLALVEALQEVGITPLINTAHCSSGSDGLYHTTARILIVCQDNSQTVGDQVDWTENDLDTLRHEAHHVLQDCRLDSLGDGNLSLYFQDEEDLTEFVVNSSFSGEKIETLIQVLREDGLSARDILLELEAYIVAADIDASLIADKLVEFCTD